MNTSNSFPPSMTEFIPRHVVVSAWERHLPFAYDLIAAHKPSVLVELGTETGLSFFGFCQSMQQQGIDGKCYAVDTWNGDEHTGPYDDEVYQSVSRHAASFYPDRATLMRMRFNEAVNHFSDESIDLLHIDGFHTYKAVKEDFLNWFPKVKPGGIILMHDIHVKHLDFGVWKLWKKKARRYDSFDFKHGFGLGVIRKPKGPVSNHPMFKLMFSGSPEQHEEFRAMYLHIAEQFELRRSPVQPQDQSGLALKSDNTSNQEETSVVQVERHVAKTMASRSHEYGNLKVRQHTLGN